MARMLVLFSYLALELLLIGVADSMPGNPFAVNIKQPDGTTLRVTTRGDEFQGWQETSEGYTVIKNPKTGYLDFATTDSAGNLIPSGVSVVRRSGTQLLGAEGAPGLRAASKGLRPRRNLELEQAQGEWIDQLRNARAVLRSPALAPPIANVPPVTGTWSPTPVSGSKKLLVILVEFLGADPNKQFDPKDARLRPGAADYWNRVVFGAGHTVATFYKDNSFGKVTISPVHHKQPGSPDGIVRVSLADPHPNYGRNFQYDVEAAWVNKALAAASSFVDFRALDTNGDGTITVDEALIYFVLGGYETAAGSGLSPSIWAHRWGGSNVEVAGKKVSNWALNGEMYDATNQMQMGVIAHEMGHAMGGLPDLYDINQKNTGLGAFSVMAAGSWGASAIDTVPAATPVGMDAWSRFYLGWSTPQYPKAGTKFSFVSAQAGNPQSAVLLLNPAVSTSEYWLVENRAEAGWDSGMYQLFNNSHWPGGLLIQHIDSNVGTQEANSFNAFVAGKHQGNVAIEAPKATCHLITANNTNGCPQILFYAGNGDSLSDSTSPSSQYYSNVASSVGLQGISPASSTMSATVNEPK